MHSKRGGFGTCEGKEKLKQKDRIDLQVHTFPDSWHVCPSALRAVHDRNVAPGVCECENVFHLVSVTKRLVDLVQKKERKHLTRKGVTKTTSDVVVLVPVICRSGRRSSLRPEC